MLHTRSAYDKHSLRTRRASTSGAVQPRDSPMTTQRLEEAAHNQRPDRNSLVPKMSQQLTRLLEPRRVESIAKQAIDTIRQRIVHTAAITPQQLRLICASSGIDLSLLFHVDTDIGIARPTGGVIGATTRVRKEEMWMELVRGGGSGEIAGMDVRAVLEEGVNRISRKERPLEKRTGGTTTSAADPIRFQQVKEVYDYIATFSDPKAECESLNRFAKGLGVLGIAAVVFFVLLVVLMKVVGGIVYYPLKWLVFPATDQSDLITKMNEVPTLKPFAIPLTNANPTLTLTTLRETPESDVKRMATDVGIRGTVLKDFRMLVYFNEVQRLQEEEERKLYTRILRGRQKNELFRALCDRRQSKGATTRDGHLNVYNDILRRDIRATFYQAQPSALAQTPSQRGTPTQTAIRYWEDTVLPLMQSPFQYETDDDESLFGGTKLVNLPGYTERDTIALEELCEFETSGRKSRKAEQVAKKKRLAAAAAKKKADAAAEAEAATLARAAAAKTAKQRKDDLAKARESHNHQVALFVNKCQALMKYVLLPLMATGGAGLFFVFSAHANTLRRSLPSAMQGFVSSDFQRLYETPSASNRLDKYPRDTFAPIVHSAYDNRLRNIDPELHAILVDHPVAAHEDDMHRLFFHLIMVHRRRRKNAAHTVYVDEPQHRVLQWIHVFRPDGSVRQSPMEVAQAIQAYPKSPSLFRRAWAFFQPKRRKSSGVYVGRTHKKAKGVGGRSRARSVQQMRRVQRRRSSGHRARLVNTRRRAR